MLFKIKRGLFKLLKCFKTMQCWSVLVFVGKFDAALGTHLLALSAAAGREEAGAGRRRNYRANRDREHCPECPDTLYQYLHYLRIKKRKEMARLSTAVANLEVELVHRASLPIVS